MSTLTERLRGWLGGMGQPASDALPVRLGMSRDTGMASSRAMGYDQALVWVTVALLAWGLVMVYSASVAMPDNPRFAKYTHTYFLYRHAMWLVIGFVAAVLAYQVPVVMWEKSARGLFIVSIILLVAVLISGIQKKIFIGVLKNNG